MKSPTDGWDSGAAGLKRMDGPLLNQLPEDFCACASDPFSELHRPGGLHPQARV